MSSMPELKTAYHEAGHCVMAVMLGGVVEVATIAPEVNDSPNRYGDVRVRWVFPPNWRAQALVALAGPAAEMIFDQEPLHPGFVSEWSEDWQIAWDSSRLGASDDPKRLLLLEQITAELYKILDCDPIWNAVAALADELLAHETIYEDQINETVRFWIR